MLYLFRHVGRDGVSEFSERESEKRDAGICRDEGRKRDEGDPPCKDDFNQIVAQFLRQHLHVPLRLCLIILSSAFALDTLGFAFGEMKRLPVAEP